MNLLQLRCVGGGVGEGEGQRWWSGADGHRDGRGRCLPTVTRRVVIVALRLDATLFKVTERAPTGLELKNGPDRRYAGEVQMRAGSTGPAVTHFVFRGARKEEITGMKFELFFINSMIFSEICKQLQAHYVRLTYFSFTRYVHCNLSKKK